MEIFLRIDGESTGPHTTYAVRALLRDGKIDPDTMAWMKGMDDWVPLRDFEPLKNDVLLRVADAGADEISVSDEERATAIHAALNPDRPKPWARFWARSVDLIAFTALVVWLAGVTGLADPAELVAYQDPTTTTMVFSIVVPVAWIFIESALLLYLQTTPGKWLLNLRVRRADGAPLELGQTFRRSFTVWWRGWGLGILPLMVLGCALANLSLTTNGKTAWDIREDLEIEQGPIQEWRVLAAIAAIIGASMLIINVADLQPSPEG